MTRKSHEQVRASRPAHNGLFTGRGWAIQVMSLLFATLTVAAGAMAAAPGIEEDEWDVPIACGPEFELDWVITHNVPKFMTSGSVPFEPDFVKLKRGSPNSSATWYTPNNTIITHGGLKWQWDDPGIYFRCSRHYMMGGTVWLDIRVPDGIEGDAVVVPPEADLLPDEEWRPGNGYAEEGGQTEEVECWEVWIVWSDETGYHEEYTGYDVCYQNGNMT